jgi:DNA uptake protein ComE-like DNA-binding protein
MRSIRKCAVSACVIVGAALSITVVATPALAATKCPVTPVNINTATDKELATVPGVGKKMIVEIKEYRPYKNFAKLEQKLTKYFPLKSVKAVEPCFTLK